MTLMYHAYRLSKRFRSYEPRPVTPIVAFRYLRQFPRDLRHEITQVLGRVSYLTSAQVKESLFDECRIAITRLLQAGIQEANILIVPAHATGESAVHSLNLIRDSLAVEFPELRFHEAGPAAARDLVRMRAESAVIFLDDFIGTGDQFTDSLIAWTSALAGRTTRFILVAAVVCSEGKARIEDRGALVQPGLIHSSDDRFLAVCLSACGEESMKRLAVLACELQSRMPFGHGNGGSMVVLSRNSPTNLPLLLRGSDGQRVWFGLFPRKDQVEPRSYEHSISKVNWPKGMTAPNLQDVGA